MTEPAEPGAAATLLVLAEVAAWEKFELPDCASYAALEEAVAARLAREGFDLEAPTPIRVRGRADDIAFHVIHGACPIARPEGPPPYRFRGAMDAVELVGIHVEGAVSILTHHGRRSHLHVIGGDMAGHLDEVVLAGVELSVPKKR